MKVNINAFLSTNEEAKYIRIRRTEENSTEFNEVLRLKTINKTLRASNEKLENQMTKSDQLFQKAIQEYHFEEKMYQKEVKFYHDQWNKCKNRFNSLRMFVDNLRDAIREEQSGSDQEIDDDLSRLRTSDREE